MDVRDRARSDLYLAQLRSQSAPNTPGFGPLSPSYSQHMKSPRFPPTTYESDSIAEEGYAGTRFVVAKPAFEKTVKPFALQPPPIKVHAATPKTLQGEFETQPLGKAPFAENRIEHAPVAPGERTYDAVPIPGAYVPPTSPQPQQQSFGVSYPGLPGQAVTSEHRIESPPGSPRLPRSMSR